MPQQNGVTKRKNRIIMEMEKSTLKTKHFPNEHWVEVVTCTTYIMS